VFAKYTFKFAEQSCICNHADFLLNTRKGYLLLSPESVRETRLTVCQQHTIKLFILLL